MGAEDEKLKDDDTKTDDVKDESKEEEKGAESGSESTDDTKTDDVKDKHGQPGINKERHEKEVAKLNARIAELEADAKKNAETKEGREKLEKQIEELKKDMAEKDLDHTLEMAGCRDLKAAKARLDDFEGDVSKLKSECPYLFEKEKQTGSTGKKPEGAPGSSDDRLKEARKAAGIRTKE